MKSKTMRLTDTEIIKLCADAMGIDVWEASDNPPEHRWRILIGRNNRSYDPFHNDADCMALIKKFKPTITPPCPIDSAWEVNIEGHAYFTDADLNRAVCECVAYYQKEK